MPIGKTVEICAIWRAAEAAGAHHPSDKLVSIDRRLSESVGTPGANGARAG